MSPLSLPSTSISPAPRLFRRPFRAGLALRLGSLLIVALVSRAADFPDGPGKQATLRVCGKCHAPELAVSLRQNRGGWEGTISKMAKMGMDANGDELGVILGYLTKNFAPAPLAPVNINTATSVDLESSLLLLKSQAAAIIQYRAGNGDFKSLDDLRKVPGLDFKKIEEKKARIIFEDRSAH